MTTKKCMVLDIDYETQEFSDIILWIKNRNKTLIKDCSFKPYFYVICRDVEKTKEILEKITFGENCKISKIENIEKNNAKNVLKLTFKTVKELQDVKEIIEQVDQIIEKREYDIPYAHRYSIDKDVSPMDIVEIIEENQLCKDIKKIEENIMPKLNMGAFDIETMSEEGIFSDPKKDEIITISYYNGKKSKVFCYAKEAKGLDNVIVCENERDMINKFVEEIKNDELDIIISYNGDSFDYPFLKERAAKYKIEINFGSGEPQRRKKGLTTAVKIKGIQNIDAYQVVRMMSRLGGLNLIKYDLESVVSAIFGTKKEKLYAEEIANIWKNRREEFERLIKYNREDAEYAYKIVEEFLPLFIELCKLCGLNLYEITRASSSQIVESLLIRESYKENYLIPNKPSEAEVMQREMQSYEGGYVKEPLPGLHENIAVLDFRSLHPSIMISHNISPETLRCEHQKCKEENMSPDKDWFCLEKKGFIPKVLERILEKRIETKNKMKKLNSNSIEYKMLDAKQHALKIILNSTYGSLGYPRFRWYSRECARAVTSWSRHYIRETFRKAEQNGFKALYGDTDSAFLIVPKNKGEKDVMNFVEKMNSELPGAMELEFEGFYKRGIFVTKKEGGAAKKRYALVDFKGNIQIVGFEYVRRDWAKIAKDTQREILEAILKDGDTKKAYEIIKQKIKLIESGKAKKEDLIIMTQLQKKVDEYEADAPHVSAVRKAIKRGKKIPIGSLISYIITRNGKSISEKAELEEYVEEGNYDTYYYVNNQLIPAVLKIMEELGYNREDLEKGGKQKTLNMFQ